MVTRVHLNNQVSSYRFIRIFCSFGNCYGCTMNSISSHWVDGIVEVVFSKVVILSNVCFTVSRFHVQFVEKKK